MPACLPACVYWGGGGAGGGGGGRNPAWHQVHGCLNALTGRQVSSTIPPQRCSTTRVPHPPTPPLPPAGDLGAIAKEYDVAVSTSCPALDYLVVDTTSAAQRCVELLRQRQLGVATFLILEKQQHLAGVVKEKKQPPEGGGGGGGGGAGGREGSQSATVP